MVSMVVARDAGARLTIVLIVVGLLASITRGQGQQTPARPSLAIDELLWWLPLDSETLEVRQPSALRPGTPLELVATIDLDSDPRAHAEILARHLTGVRVKASVEGSRRFRPPTGLGGMLYEGATLYRLEKPLASSATLMAELAKQALSVSRIGEFDVAEFRDTLEEDVHTSYLTMPRPDLLIVATNLEYLKDVLKRATVRSGARAFPLHLPEWRWIDVTSPYWALRHYRREHSAEDPTSPFVREPAAGVHDNGALGLAAHAERDGRTMVVHYLSKSADAVEVMQRYWSRSDESPSTAIRSVDTGVVEVRLTAGNDDQLKLFFFHLFAALGHAIYL
jgi:hypothetical protein